MANWVIKAWFLKSFIMRNSLTILVNSICDLAKVSFYRGLYLQQLNSDSDPDKQGLNCSFSKRNTNGFIECSFKANTLKDCLLITVIQYWRAFQWFEVSLYRELW